MAGTKFHYRVEGLAELLKKADKRVLLGPPLRSFFDKAAGAVKKFAQLRSPLRTGRLQESIDSKVDPADVPLSAEVGVTDASIRYPYVLEFSSKTHYRSTSGSGSPTKGGLSSTPDDAQDEVKTAVGELGRDIEAAWQA